MGPCLCLGRGTGSTPSSGGTLGAMGSAAIVTGRRQENGMAELSRWGEM